MEFNIQYFWAEEPAVQIHVVAAVYALVIGVFVFSRRKGGKIHRAMGISWVGAMALVAFSSFLIHGLRNWGPFSPVHLLSLWTLGCLVFAIWAIRQRKVRAHQYTLTGLYIGGLLGAGVLAFSRDLLMHRIFFGESGLATVPSPGELPGGPVVSAFVVAAAVFTGLVAWAMWRNRKAHRPVS